MVDGKPRGYYLLAQRLFQRGAPILRKQQWIGFADRLVVTVDYPVEYDSLLKMVVGCTTVGTGPVIGGDRRTVTWLASAKLWPMAKGFKTYIPSSILTPTSSPCGGVYKAIHTHGLFSTTEMLSWLEIPILDGEVLLRRKELY